MGRYVRSHSFVNHTKNILLPCLLLSAATGVLTGALVYGFKCLAHFLVELAHAVYGWVAVHPACIPLLLAALAGLAGVSTALLTWCPAARGGGIPSAIGILRGILHFRWLKTLFATVVSACVSFAAGLPLGNEGPSVQIGTALGRGVTRLAGARNRAWDRYLMTGGASAGFAAATGAPISGIFFALEEAHKRFSPMILMSSLASVLCASLTVQELSALSGGSATFLTLPTPAVLSLHDMWLPVVIGLAAGVCAVLYALLFRGIDRVWRQRLAALPLFWKVLTVLLLSGAAGLISVQAVGSGHAVMEAIFAQKLLWSLLLQLLLMKFVLTLLASNTGVTGGLFIPILTIGALIGGLMAPVLGVSGDRAVTVILIATASFMAATMHTPVTALLFSVEALAGLSNVLYISIGIFLAYTVMETLDVQSINDVVLRHRIADQNRGKVRLTREATVAVQPGAFAAGKTLRDVFLPDNCLILSVARRDRVSMANGGEKTLREGDVLRLHCGVYESEQAQLWQTLCDLFGEQKIEIVAVDTAG